MRSRLKHISETSLYENIASMWTGLYVDNVWLIGPSQCIHLVLASRVHIPAEHINLGMQQFN